MNTMVRMSGRAGWRYWSADSGWLKTCILYSGGAAGQLPNSGFFGNYLDQSPGWWTVVEATIMLFWVVYATEAISRSKSR